MEFGMFLTATALPLWEGGDHEEYTQFGPRTVSVSGTMQSDQRSSN